MPRYKALLSYDGTRYFGWQKTRSGPSIQEALQSALQKVTRNEILPEAASRTDRGVHAEGQSVSFSLDKDLPKPLFSLNANLPSDIRILSIETVPEGFHPTLDALSKIYHYEVSLGPIQDPHTRLYSWHYPYPLDLSKMEAGAKILLGTHDFSAFANRPEKNPTCTLSHITFSQEDPNRLRIALHGNRFLYKMARSLAGTLLYIGSGKLALESLPSILLGKKRKEAGMTAPAHGLFLHRVIYSENG